MRAYDLFMTIVYGVITLLIALVGSVLIARVMLFVGIPQVVFKLFIPVIGFLALLGALPVMGFIQRLWEKRFAGGNDPNVIDTNESKN